MIRTHKTINNHPGVAVMSIARMQLRALGVFGTAEDYEVRMGSYAYAEACDWLGDEPKTANKAAIVLDETLHHAEVKAVKR